MKAGRRRIAVTVVALVAAVTPAAFSKSAAAPANYVLQVDFGVGYEVTWSSQSGDPATPCSEWRATKVTNEVNAKSGKPPPSKIYAIRGLFTDFAVLPKKIRDKIKTSLGWSRYEFVAVGAAHGTISRRRLETGGANWNPDCGIERFPPFRPPSNDCGERSFKTDKAALKAAFRDFDGTLESLRRDKTEKFAITFNVAPPLSLYRKCEVESRFAPDYPVFVGLVLPPGFVSPGLARMKVGDVRHLDHQYAGQCVKDITPPDRCTYSLNLNVRIRRTH